MHSLFRSESLGRKLKSRRRLRLETLERRYVLDSTVVFNEIMYHPPDDDSLGEWIELHNQMSVNMDLSQWSLSAGVEFAFPDNTVIPGGGYLVIAENPAALAAAGVSLALGPFQGSLANGGERLELRDNNDRLMDWVEYDDAGDWPVGPDGGGVALAKADRLESSDDARHWTFSERLGGTPGRVNFPTEDDLEVEIPLITSQSTVSAHVPTSEQLLDVWTETGFVEGDEGDVWISGLNGVGFDNGEEVGVIETYSEAVLSDLPLAYWPLNDSGPTVLDASGKGHHGSATGGVLFNRASLLPGEGDGRSVITQGSERVTIPAFEKLPAGSTGFTVEYWITLLSAPTTFHNIVGDGESGGDFYMMNYLTGAGRIRPHYSFANSPVSTDSNQVLQVGRTYHVVTTWDRIQGQSSIYIDGQHDKTVGVSTNTPSNTNNVIYLGKDQREPGGHFQLDEVSFYTYPLSEERIQAHARAGGLDLDPGLPPDFNPVIQTNVEQQMLDISTSAYVRAEFALPSSFEIQSLTLDMRYDDGFVAYLNGQEVARRNAPSPIAFDSRATDIQSKRAALLGESFDLTAHKDQLTSQTNVLAIHGLNASVDNGDLLILPELSVTGIPIRSLAASLHLQEIAPVDDAEFWLELRNDGATTISLGETALAIRGQTDAEYSLPAVNLAPGELYVVSETVSGLHPAAGDRLFLYGGDQLLDARVASDRLRGRSDEFGDAWLYPTAPTPGADNLFAVNSDIVIHEIMYHPRPGQEEWIELYNRGDAAVDMSGWRLSGAVNYTFPAAASLGAGQYLVIADSVASLAAKFPDATVNGPFSGSLNNGGELIELLDQHGNPADQVEYFDGGRWPSEADGFGSSLELIHPEMDNNVAEAWRASEEGSKSEWVSVSYRGRAVNGAGQPVQYNEFLLGLLDSGQILIDDVQVIEDPNGAARSLIQNGSFDADPLGGEAAHWRIIGDQQGKVIDDPTEAGGNRVLQLTATGATEHKHNNAGTTLKSGASFVTINPSLDYEISFRAKWLAGANLVHSRLYFNRVAQAIELPVPAHGGTPGQSNSTEQIVTGPTYRDLVHEPISPRASENVSVSVRAADPQGIFAATLWYSVNSGALRAVPMSIAGDLLRAEIPGQASGSTVQFFVEASDGQGIPSAFPAGGRNSRALVRFGSPLENDQLQTMQILMTPTDQALLSQWTNLMSNDRMGATVVSNGRVYYDVGLRLKGSQRGRTDVNRRGYSVEFSADDKFRGVHTTVSLDRSGGWRYGRTFGQDEIAIRQFFNRAGDIPSMYNDLVMLDAPGVTPGPAQLLMARFDDVYLDSQFDNGSEGTLHNYELVYYPTTTVGGTEGLKNPNPDGVIGLQMQNLGDNKEAYRWHFENKNRRADDDYDAIVRLNQTFGLSGNAFLQQADQVLDVDQWLRTNAAVSLAGVSDSYFNNTNLHNARFYERPSDGKILLFAWDMDFAFITSTSFTIRGNPDLNRLLASPHNYHSYLGHLDDIMDVSFNGAYMDDWLTHFGSLLPGQDFNALLGWIQSRASFVNSTIRSTVAPVDFQITTADTTVDTPVATIAGRGWVDVREIRVQGGSQPLNVRWTSLDRWEASLTAPFGETNFTLEAYDFRGNLIGSDVIAITSTATDPRVNESLRITEVMYNPPAVTPAEASAGYGDKDDFEFLELRNVGAETIDITGVRIDDGVQFTFGNVQLAAGERVVVVENPTAFQARYGAEVNMAGVWQGQLSNSGESLLLVDAQNTVIQQFSYQDGGSWPGRADGNGSSLEILDPLASAEDGANWRSSAEYGGSPGSAGMGPRGDILVNEVLSHTDPPQVDAVELLNTTDAAIDLSGWYLSDSSANYAKYRIPENTLLPGGGYLVFDETDFNPTPETPGPLDFAFNGAEGDDVWLLQADETGRLMRFVDHVSFPAQANGESWGRWPNAVGQLYPMTAPSLGGANPGPRIGPLVINEVHYHPVDPDGEGPIDPEQLEFVEIYNPTASSVDLTHWRLNGAVQYEFPAGLQLGAGQTVVAVAFDPQSPDDAQRLIDFRASYAVADGVLLVGGFEGRLDNTGEPVRLLRPDAPPLDQPELFPGLLEDEVRYQRQAPWPTDADGGGASLTRIGAQLWGNDAASWFAAAPSPGRLDESALRVLSLVINGGESDPADLNGRPQPAQWRTQRSQIRSILVEFSKPIEASAADIVLTNLGVNAPADPDRLVTLDESSVTVEGNRLLVRFETAPLDEGVYRIELLPGIVDLSGGSLDGNGDGAGGDSFVMTGDEQNRFYQLLGEWNGDGGVTIFDFATFAYWFGAGVGVAPHYVDLNGDGGVTIFDFPSFAGNFGRAVTFPPMLAAAMPGQREPGSTRDEEAVQDLQQPVERLLEDRDRLFRDYAEPRKATTVAARRTELATEALEAVLDELM